MRRTSSILHFSSLVASGALILSATINFIFTVLWHYPNGPSSSLSRTTEGRCHFDFDVFWTGTGRRCSPGIGWGYLFAGSVIRLVLTTIIPGIMHLSVWKWTHSRSSSRRRRRETLPSSRGMYTSVAGAHAQLPTDADVVMMERKWALVKKSKSGRPPALNLNKDTRHSRHLSGDSIGSIDTISSTERSPTPTAEQLKEWAAQYRTNLQTPSSEEERDGEASSIQFAACDTPSPSRDEFGDYTSASDNPNIRLGRVPGLVRRLSTIESASEGGISRASTFGRATPSASGHMSFTGWSNEFGVAREDSRGTNGTNGTGTSSSSNNGPIRRMDSFVSAFSYLQQTPSSSPTSPLHPRLPDRAATADSIGSIGTSSTRTEYFNAVSDVEGEL